MASWPDERCPPTRGPTAREHLDHILLRAHRENAAQLADIEKAVEACLGGNCLRGDPPQRGRAPARGHGSAVLWARALADEDGWDECLNALKHGDAATQKKKSKPAST